MAANFLTTFLNTFSWMKMLDYRLKYHSPLFLRVQLTHSIIGSDNGLVPLGDKPMLVSLLTHICVTRPQWVNMVVMRHVSYRGPDLGQIPSGHECPTKHSGQVTNTNKNLRRHTAHTIVSWPNFKQWIIVHTSDLMMIMKTKYIYIIFQASQGKLVIWKHTAPYIV